jgi:hypothetical protein
LSDADILAQASTHQRFGNVCVFSSDFAPRLFVHLLPFQSQDAVPEEFASSVACRGFVVVKRRLKENEKKLSWQEEEKQQSVCSLVCDRSSPFFVFSSLFDFIDVQEPAWVQDTESLTNARPKSIRSQARLTSASDFEFARLCWH